MKRRHLFQKTALTVGSTASMVACRVASQPAPVASDTHRQPTFRWRMATSFPKSLDLIFGAVEFFCQRVNAMTDGRFVITPYEAGELVAPLDILDAVRDQTVDCGFTVSSYFIGKNQALAFSTGLPFGLSASQQNAWLYYGGGLEAIQSIYRDLGVVSFPCGNSGAQMGGWFRREMSTVADFKGLKIRIIGLGAEVLRRLGAEPQVLPANEIFEALVQDKIEAVEFIGPYDDEKLGLNKAASYYYYPGWWEPGATNEVLFNMSQWEQLPQEYQEILQITAAETNLRLLAHYNAANGEALDRFIAGGTQLKSYNTEFLQAAYKTAFELYEELAAQDAVYRKIYEQWKTFRKQVYQWNRINELSFVNFSISAES